MDKSWLKKYDPGVPHQFYIPEITLPQVFDRSLKYPGKTAMIYFGREFTYLHLSRLVNRFYTGLLNSGVKKGDRVALVLPNIPQFVIAYWAALKLGAVVVLINPLLSGRELHYQIQTSGARLAIMLDRHLSKYKELEFDHLETIIAAGVETYMPFFMNMAFQIKKHVVEARSKTRLPLKILLFRELLGSEKAVDQACPGPDDPAVLIFTGGVTGTPKAAVLSHRNLIANMLQARKWIPDFKEEQEVIMTALPLIHSYGMTACHHLAIGSCSAMVLYPRFYVKRILDDIVKFQSGIFPGVPTMYAAILEEVKRRDLKSLPLRVCISGGAPLPLKLQQEFEAVTGTRLVEGYGLSEASPVTHCNPVYGLRKEKSIGLPWPNTEARVVHQHTRQVLPDGETGELEIRGPQVMLQYWNENKETHGVKDKDGWLKTGDFAYKDSDGYFYIADRIKDVIFYGGENIYPSEIEKVLCKHPKVKEAAVVGVDDQYYGQVVKAYIIAEGPEPPATEELLAFCAERLAKYELPRFFKFMDRFPKNYLGKVLKRQLKETE